MIEKDIKSLVLIFIVVTLMLLSVVATYWKMIVINDFEIVDDTEEEFHVEGENNSLKE